MAIERALLSVTDKTGLVEFATELQQLRPNLRLLASGNTARTLRSAGLEVIDVADYTSHPECFGGRIKTLHPRIMGGVLLRRGEDDEEAGELGIDPIDLVVCNLYDFEGAVARGEESTESIDIGGPTLVRAAAKNWRHVVVAVHPEQYGAILDAERSGGCSDTLRGQLAARAFAYTADYEAAIASHWGREFLGEESERPAWRQGRKLRYGENPSQEGWLYCLKDESGVAGARKLSGKELSYNNLVDASAAYGAVSELESLGLTYCAVVVKHAGLCGFATGSSSADALERAWEGDSKSAFGSVIALSTEVNESVCEVLQGKYVEVLLAPRYTAEAVEWLQSKKPNLRVLQVQLGDMGSRTAQTIAGGVLVQTVPTPSHPQSDWKCVTRVGLIEGRESLCRFAIAAVRQVKSNGVVLAYEEQPGSFTVIGVGGGQPNRVDSLERLALPKALENLRRLRGERQVREAMGECVLASDGFFPFPDSIEVAVAAGVRTFVQPGGSKRDPEVIAAADKADACMLFTGERYFSH